jgi:hypothetical protein
MSGSSRDTGAAAFDARAIGRIFWPRKSIAVLMGAALGLWAVPVGIVYGVVSSF